MNNSDNKDQNEIESIQDLEIRLLTEGIFQRYGLDYRGYAFSSLKRRVLNRLEMEGLSSVSALQEKVLHKERFMDLLFGDLSIGVTEMFRDPKAFRSFREKIIPELATYRAVRIWHAGCATGEEVYSVAIMLKEAGIYDKTRIYATDINPNLLDTAKKGICNIDRMKLYTQNYIESGGNRSFSEYYIAAHGHAKFRDDLIKNVVFFPHNLALDGSFNEFNAILCRNVMIYFGKELQNRVHKLLHDSLIELGFLMLGTKENIRFTALEKNYETIDAREKIYCKVQ